MFLCCKSTCLSLCLLFRLTDMKWQSVTTRHQPTLQITKWRASSHKPTSFPEEASESGKKEEEEEDEEMFQWRLLTVIVEIQDDFSAAWRQVGWARRGSSTEIWPQSFRCAGKCHVVALFSMAIKQLNVGRKLNNKCMKHFTRKTVAISLTCIHL